MPVAIETRSASRARDALALTLVGTALGVAVVYVIVFAWGSLGPLNDFTREAWPAYRALEHGHLQAFFKLGPAYFGSLELRAPFLALAGLFGGGWRGAYLATALPCLAAGPALGAWLAGLGAPRSEGRGRRISPLVLCAINPPVLVCLGFGHPEEALGAALCVAAVGLASRGSATWAGVLTGLAIANKPWALAVAPVVLAYLPDGKRRRGLVAMAAVAAVLLGPALIIRTGGLSGLAGAAGAGAAGAGAAGAGAGGAAGSLGSSTVGLFLPPQLLYWLGPGSWAVREAHVLIILAGAACAGLWWWLRARRPRPGAEPPDTREALLLLALVLLLRGALDPWDNVYYQVPFLFAIMAYEAGRAPRLTIGLSLLLLAVVPPHLLPVSPRAHAVLYAAVAIPVLVWLAARVYLPDGIRPPSLAAQPVTEST